jgi:hypothetical protein
MRNTTVSKASEAGLTVATERYLRAALRGRALGGDLVANHRQAAHDVHVGRAVQAVMRQQRGRLYQREVTHDTHIARGILGMGVGLADNAHGNPVLLTSCTPCGCGGAGSQSIRSAVARTHNLHGARSGHLSTPGLQSPGVCGTRARLLLRAPSRSRLALPAHLHRHHVLRGLHALFFRCVIFLFV